MRTCRSLVRQHKTCKKDSKQAAFQSSSGRLWKTTNMAAARPPVRSAPKSSGRQSPFRRPTGGCYGNRAQTARPEVKKKQRETNMTTGFRTPASAGSRKRPKARVHTKARERERRASRTPRQQAIFRRRHSNGERALYHEGVLLPSVTQTVYRRGRVTPSAICGRHG